MADIGIVLPPTDSEEMKPNVFGLLRADLGIKGYSQEWIDNAIGGTPGGRDKSTIVYDLKEALRNEAV